MFCYYIERGHSIHDLVTLTVIEKIFYRASMELINKKED